MCGSISKPCKNNKEVVINQRQPPPSSAFERHQIALEKERESVQVNFVSCAIGTRWTRVHQNTLQQLQNNMDDHRGNTVTIQEASHQINYLRNGLKPYARTRTVAFQKPKRFSFYEISSVNERSTLLSSSLLASDCKQSQILLKSAPPSDESQPH